MQTQYLFNPKFVWTYIHILMCHCHDILRPNNDQIWWIIDRPF